MEVLGDVVRLDSMIVAKISSSFLDGFGEDAVDKEEVFDALWVV